MSEDNVRIHVLPKVNIPWYVLLPVVAPWLLVSILSWWLVQPFTGSWQDTLIAVSITVFPAVGAWFFYKFSKLIFELAVNFRYIQKMLVYASLTNPAMYVCLNKSLIRCNPEVIARLDTDNDYLSQYMKDRYKFAYDDMCEVQEVFLETDDGRKFLDSLENDDPSKKEAEEEAA